MLLTWLQTKNLQTLDGLKSEKGDEEGEPDEIYIESMGEEVYEEALQWSIN